VNLFEKYTTTSTTQETFTPRGIRTGLREFQVQLGPYLPENKDARICELGCGTGRNIHFLKVLGYVDCCGVDISEEQILTAKRVFDLDNVTVGSALEWLEKCAAFDAILILDVLEHFDRGESVRLVSLAFQRLRPGGVLIVRVPNASCPMAAYFYGDITHFRAYNPESLRQTMRMAGITDRVDLCSLPPVCNSLSNTLRRVVWSFIVFPALHLLALILYPHRLTGHYTPNIQCVVRKSFPGRTA
jgi:SAM-dependent methyltransferase